MISQQGYLNAKIICLIPLLKEMQELWTSGFMCQDIARWRKALRFNIGSLLLWCVHDFPTYILIAGTTNKGYGTTTSIDIFVHLKKMFYCVVPIELLIFPFLFFLSLHVSRSSSGLPITLVFQHTLNRVISVTFSIMYLIMLIYNSKLLR